MLKIIKREIKEFRSFISQRKYSKSVGTYELIEHIKDIIYYSAYEHWKKKKKEIMEIMVITAKKAEVFIINFDISKQFRQMYDPKIN